MHHKNGKYLSDLTELVRRAEPLTFDKSVDNPRQLTDALYGFFYYAKPRAEQIEQGL
ncbi:MAG: hypothetical protein ABSG65_29765 [Bryobacteraceae bacterium]|jgi:hypothetical protein